MHQLGISIGFSGTARNLDIKSSTATSSHGDAKAWGDVYTQISFTPKGMFDFTLTIDGLQ